VLMGGGMWGGVGGGKSLSSETDMGPGKDTRLKHHLTNPPARANPPPICSGLFPGFLARTT